MKKTKTWKIVLLVLLAFLIYALPTILIILFGIFEESPKKFEIKDNIVEISKGKMTITDMESFYNEEDNTYYVTGYLKNKTDKTYTGLSIEIRLYDKEGNILGEETSYLETLKENKTWRFKISYSGIDSKEVDSYEITEIYYY